MSEETKMELAQEAEALTAEAAVEETPGAVEEVAKEPEAEEAAKQLKAEEIAKQPEVVETMADYEKELEASFKRVREGDVLSGTVIGVTDEKVIVDLKYYAEGVIAKEDVSNDPDFNLKEEIHVGDPMTASVVKTDDGQGNILLSKKEANDLMAWDKLVKMLQERTIVKVKIAEIVKSGVVAYLEGIRGFIPASKLSAEYVEDLNEWKGKTIEVTVITADPEEKRLVMSGREVAREKLAEEKNKKIAKCQVGVVMEGTVDSLKPYGAFVNLENGLSGLIHVSQISNQRIKHPGAVLKEGQTVKVKIISTENNKISLSMKALEAQDEVGGDGFEYHESGKVTTGLGSILKGLKF